MPYIDRNIDRRYLDGTAYRNITTPYHHELSDVTYMGTISTDSIQSPRIIMSDLMKEGIKKLFDEWCGEIVDGKVDKGELDTIFPIFNHHQILINDIKNEIQERDAMIHALQTQLEELQEQLKYLGFEKLLME